MTPTGSQPAYSSTAWKMAMAWNAYVHPQKASLSFSEPPHPLLATRLHVGAETSHRRERQGVQGVLPQPPVPEAERFNQVLSRELGAPSSDDGERVPFRSLGGSHGGFPCSDRTLQGYRCICWTLQVPALTPGTAFTFELSPANIRATVSLTSLAF